MTRYRLGSWLLVSTLAGLVACGGSGGSVTVEAPETPRAEGLLRPASADELRDLLQASLLEAPWLNGHTRAPVPFEAEAGVTDDAASAFSGTNVQEAGVDEADILKYDGEVLYVLHRGDVFFGVNEELGITVPQPRDVSIRLYYTEPQLPAAELLATIGLPVDAGSVEGIYLHAGGQGKQVVAVGHRHGFVDWSTSLHQGYWLNGQTGVGLWRVDDPAQPQQRALFLFDGDLLASRRIGDTLFLVTRHSASPEGIVAYPQDEQEQAANRDAVAALSLEELLPGVSVDGGERSPLLEAEDCLVPNPSYTALRAPSAGTSLVTVTALDLETATVSRSLCLNSFASSFYVSPASLYVTAGQDNQQTLLHKVALSAEGPEYRGSGAVPGYIGGPAPAFMMSEHEGDLRVLSSFHDAFPEPGLLDEADSTGSDPGPSPEDGLGRHRLTILRESEDSLSLEVLSRLPNTASPDHIGKPGEDVYAVRFLGDRAYVVTFEIIDPLYALDLSDPARPQIAGELELPGFSTLLQPLGDTHLLGVGHEVAGDGFTQGVKVALFDVANLAAPVLTGEVVIGRRGSGSPALYDHRALAVLAENGQYRVGLVIDRHAEPAPGQDPENPVTWFEWSDTAAHLFEVDTASGSLLALEPVMLESRSEEQRWPTGGSWGSRLVHHGDAVFILYGGEVMASRIAAP